MKVACVLIPHLRAFVELRRRPCLKKRPIVIVDRSGARPVVADFMPDGSGMRQGMPLEQAMSLYGGTRVLEADDPHYREVFDRVTRSPARSQRQGGGGGVGDRLRRPRRTGGDVWRRGPAGPCPAERRVPGLGATGWVWPTASSPPTWRPRLAALKEPSVRSRRRMGAFLARHSINLLPVSRPSEGGDAPSWAAPHGGRRFHEWIRPLG